MTVAGAVRHVPTGIDHGGGIVIGVRVALVALGPAARWEEDVAAGEPALPGIVVASAEMDPNLPE